MVDSEFFVDDSTPLLNKPSIQDQISLKTGPRKYIYIYSGIASLSGFIFGFDIASIAAIIDLPNFQNNFFIHGSIVYYESVLISIYLVACMSGSFLSSNVYDRLGAKMSLLLSSSCTFMGLLIELFGYSISVIVFGRVICGLGYGFLNNLTPIYSSELAPPDIRGRLVGGFTLLQIFGQLIGYIVSFGCSYLHSNWSWRGPWVLQAILLCIFTISVFYIPQSPKWLIENGKKSESLKVLSTLYGLPQDHEAIKAEYVQIKTLIDNENAKGDEATYAELFEYPNLERTICGIALSIAGCLAGNIIASFFAPQIFNSLGLTGVEVSIALTGGMNLLSLVLTAISIQWWIDSWGRKVLFYIGSGVSAVTMIITGIMFQNFAVIVNDQFTVLNIWAQYTIIICFYVSSSVFSSTWIVAVYAYTIEIFSLRCFSKGVSISYSASWAGGIVISFLTPYLLNYSISGTYYFFGVCSTLIFIGVSFLPETKGKSSAEIDSVFEKISF